MQGKLKKFSWLALLCGLLAVCVRSARPVDADLFASMGTPLPREVSRDFAAAQGVQILQLTDDPYGSEISDYDIPVYQSETRRLFWNTLLHPETNEWAFFTAQWPELKPRMVIRRVAPNAETAHMDISYDARIATYPRVNDSGDSWDFYGLLLQEEFQELRITEQNYPLREGDSIVTSPASWDAKAERYLMAYGINSDLFLVYADGGNQFAQVGPWQPTLTDLSGDPRRRENDTRLARVRINPVHASLLLFRRYGVGDLWMHDIRASMNQSVRISDVVKTSNPQWTPDGIRVGAKEHGVWVERTVATLLGDGVGKRSIANVKKKVMGAFGGLRPEGAVFYAAYSRDGTYVAVATDHRQSGGGKLYLLDTKTGKTRLLCDLRSSGADARGQPRIGFLEGQSALLFSSDHSAGLEDVSPPQIFMVRW